MHAPRASWLVPASILVAFLAFAAVGQSVSPSVLRKVPQLAVTPADLVNVTGTFTVPAGQQSTPIYTVPFGKCLIVSTHYHTYGDLDLAEVAGGAIVRKVFGAAMTDQPNDYYMNPLNFDFPFGPKFEAGSTLVLTYPDGYTTSYDTESNVMLLGALVDA